MPRQRSTDVADSDYCGRHGDSSLLLDTATNESYPSDIALAKLAVDGDLVESILEDGEFLLVELRDEQFRDPAQVDGSSLGEARHAGVGQRDDDTASVSIGVGSSDEAF